LNKCIVIVKINTDVTENRNNRFHHNLTKQTTESIYPPYLETTLHVLKKARGNKR